MKLVKGVTLLSAAMMLAACGSSSSSDDEEQAPVVNAPETYEFTSKIDTSVSSVSYSGQSTRHILIDTLVDLIESEDLYNVTQDEAGKAEVIERLNRVYAIGTKTVTGKLNLADKNVLDGTVGATPLFYGVEAPTVLSHTDYSVDQGLSIKNLQDKLAGKDNDLTNPFYGWVIELGEGQTDNDRPEILIQSWFAAIADLATDEDLSTTYTDPSTGLNYLQLIQKFILGAVAYSQAAEDYLKPSKGLLETNIAGDDNYTSLEHQWDEGFGYFGASRDYNLRSDFDIRKVNGFNTNEDGILDLYSEYSFGNSINAAKRDDADDITGVDFTKGAMDAFLNGRQLIQDNFGTDPVEGSSYHKFLAQYAETALNNWENAIAATVIHYINDYTADLNAVSNANPEDSFDNLTIHWAEMKGFALGLQFSPVAQISTTDLNLVHDKMGQLPVLEAGDAAIAYLEALAEARDILQAAYGFSDNNVANW